MVNRKLDTQRAAPTGPRIPYNTMHNTAIISTPERIAAYKLASLITALKIETRTGVKVTKTPLLKYARQQYNITARTKAAAIPQLETIYEDVINNL
jgi:hypothetical protein